MKNTTAVAPAPTAKTAAQAPTVADVEKLHAKMEAVERGLKAMLAANGALAQSKIGAEMQLFTKELDGLLNSTKLVKDPAVAYKKLSDAKASMSELTSELTNRQVALMKEEEAQQESLLLGVLMTRQKEPLDEQLKILANGDFAKLEVSKALLAKHDDKTPLYAQVAQFLDAHHGKGAAQQAMSGVKDRASAQEKATALAASFEKRVSSMKKENEEKKKHHLQRVQDLQLAIKKASKSIEKGMMKSILKREERNFKKWSAMQKHDIDALQNAITAIKNHDMKALDRARDALAESIKSLQSKNSGFLVLAQLGHKLMEKDCPYCAAQCVDKCHQAGKSFTTCLTDCADAGKQ